MGEIHDAYDTILILDFGSQVWFLSSISVPSHSFIVQPSDNSEMQRAQRLRRAYALYTKDQRSILEAQRQSLLAFGGLTRAHTFRTTHRNYPLGVSLLGIR